MRNYFPVRVTEAAIRRALTGDPTFAEVHQGHVDAADGVGYLDHAPSGAVILGNRDCGGVVIACPASVRLSDAAEKRQEPRAIVTHNDRGADERPFGQGKLARFLADRARTQNAAVLAAALLGCVDQQRFAGRCFELDRVLFGSFGIVAEQFRVGPLGAGQGGPPDRYVGLAFERAAEPQALKLAAGPGQERGVVLDAGRRKQSFGPAICDRTDDAVHVCGNLAGRQVWHDSPVFVD